MKNLISLISFITLTSFAFSCRDKDYRVKIPEIPDAPAETVQRGRAMSKYIYLEKDSVINSKNVHIQCYYPFSPPGDRCVYAYEIRTFEFGDSSISVTVGLPHFPAKITINTPDSFIMISYVEGNRNLRDTLMDLRILRKFISQKRHIFPPAQFDSSGIIIDQRNQSWIACFEIDYTEEGVRISNEAFSYLVKYPSNRAVLPNKKQMFRFSQRLLPPFLLYSLKDYRHYFGPILDSIASCRFDEFERRNVYGAPPIFNKNIEYIEL